MADFLVVVDYQTDFVAGTMGFPEARALEVPLSRAVEQQLTRGGRVLFTLDRCGAHTRSEKHRRDGWSLYGALERFVPRVQLIEKDSFGARALVTDGLIPDGASIAVCGVVTHLCVLSNVILLQTACPNSAIEVDAALCASPDHTLAQAAFDLLEHLHVSVINRSEGGHTGQGRDRK
ncbi:MAG: cysteine hydrolase [Butyricicoccaceae bacterium]